MRILPIFFSLFLFFSEKSMFVSREILILFSQNFVSSMTKNFRFSKKKQNTISYIRVDRISTLLIVLSDREVVFARNLFGQVEHMHLFMRSSAYANSEQTNISIKHLSLFSNNAYTINTIQLP